MKYIYVITGEHIDMYVFDTFKGAKRGLRELIREVGGNLKTIDVDDIEEKAYWEDDFNQFVLSRYTVNHEDFDLIY